MLPQQLQVGEQRSEQLRLSPVQDDRIRELRRLPPRHEDVMAPGTLDLGASGRNTVVTQLVFDVTALAGDSHGAEP